MTIEEWANQQKALVHDPLDLPLFEEIIGCLNAGFRRSAYIMSWVGIAENLKNKILQSANLGDAAAAKALEEIGELENKQKSVDRYIMDKVVELNLVDTNDKGTLEFLWAQRSIYAHPYQVAPSEDDTKFIISKLVEICLAKPLLYKKAFLDEMIKNLVDKPFFLPGDEASVSGYCNAILPRVTQDLRPYLFKNLLAALGGIDMSEAKRDIRFKLRKFLMKVLAESDLSLEDAKWSLEHRATNFPFTLLYGCVNTDTWPRFPDRIKRMLVDYALAEVDETKRNQIKNTFYTLVKSAVLEEDYRLRYFQFLDEIHFTYVINFYGDKPQILKRILADMDTGNYDKQNPVIEFIKSDNGSQLLKRLTASDRREVGRRLTYAAKGNNWSAIGYLDNLSNQENLPAAFVAGILDGTLFNRENGFNVDLNRFHAAVKLLEKLPQDVAFEILDGLKTRVAEVGEGSKHFAVDAQIDAAKGKLQELQPEIGGKADELLEVLRPFKYVMPEGW